MAPWFSSPSAKAPATDAVLTRALNPRGTLDFVRTRGGAPAIVRVLTALPPDDRALLSDPQALAERGWIPFGTQARLLAAVDQILGTGDGTLLFQVGEHMAHRDIPRFFRPMLRLGPPGWVVSFGIKMWGHYHNAGRWEVTRTPVTVLATLHDHPAEPAFCATFVGWLSATLTLGGGVNVMVDHPVCHARGAPNCVFTARWNRKRTRHDATEPVDRDMLGHRRPGRTSDEGGGGT